MWHKGDANQFLPRTCTPEKKTCIKMVAFHHHHHHHNNNDNNNNNNDDDDNNNNNDYLYNAHLVLVSVLYNNRQKRSCMLRYQYTPNDNIA